MLNGMTLTIKRADADDIALVQLQQLLFMAAYISFKGAADSDHNFVDAEDGLS